MPRQTCGGCKWWSEMIASAKGGGPIRAYCFNPKNPAKGYRERMTCDGCELKELGLPVDHPALRAEREEFDAAQ